MADGAARTVLMDWTAFMLLLPLAGCSEAAPLTFVVPAHVAARGGAKSPLMQIWPAVSGAS